MYTFKTNTWSILLVFISNLSVMTTVALATFIYLLSFKNHRPQTHFTCIKLSKSLCN